MDSRRKLIGEILGEIQEHEKAFQEPCPFRVLTLKFFKRAEPLGSLKPILRELESDGTLTSIRLRTGALLYTLKGSL